MTGWGLPKYINNQVMFGDQFASGYNESFNSKVDCTENLVQRSIQLTCKKISIIFIVLHILAIF